MTESVGIVVATYGSDVPNPWMQLAVERALPSARNQTVRAQVVFVHGDSLHQARNLGADGLDTDWLIFLDADDELDEHYVEAMLAGAGDIRQPATIAFGDGDPGPFSTDVPSLLPERDLRSGNYIVIGAMVRRDLFVQHGGFDDFPIYEDWALWLKLSLAGASIGSVPDAVYRVHVAAESRNNQDRAFQVRWYRAIRERFGVA